MNAPVAATSNPSPTGDVESAQTTPPEGLSAFIARILDQLSISAWLPAALAVSGIYFAVRLSMADGDAKAALASVGGTQLEQLLVLLGAVVILTTVTQAFEFSSIRLLEGYWGAGRLPQALADLFAGRYERLERGAIGRRQELQVKAFKSAEAGYAAAVNDIDIIRYLHAGLLDLENIPELTAAQEEVLDFLDWRDFAAAGAMRRLEMHEISMKRFPSASQIMPTRLGNLLRASEERANKGIPGSVQGMVHRTYHLIPGHLQIETDQFRNRLGLYASLVVTEFVVAISSAIILLPTGLDAAASIAAIHIALVALFYRATLGSADAYGELLETVAALVSATDAD